jgi:hypothetical protein
MDSLKPLLLSITKSTFYIVIFFIENDDDDDDDYEEEEEEEEEEELIPLWFHYNEQEIRDNIKSSFFSFHIYFKTIYSLNTSKNIDYIFIIFIYILSFGEVFCRTEYCVFSFELARHLLC